MNVLTTSLIAGRIMWLKRDLRNAFGEGIFGFGFFLIFVPTSTHFIEGVRHMAYYDRVVAIVVESGSVYTAALICQLILYTLKQTSTRITFAIFSQLNVGAFCCIRSCRKR